MNKTKLLTDVMQTPEGECKFIRPDQVSKQSFDFIKRWIELEMDALASKIVTEEPDNKGCDINGYGQ